MEHSWSDGPIIGHIYEEVMFTDYYCYDEKGNIKGSYHLTQPLPPPVRLNWDFHSADLTKTISDAYSDALKMIDVSALRKGHFDSKNFKKY